MQYEPSSGEGFKIEVAQQNIAADTFNQEELKKLSFTGFKNGSKYDFKEVDKSTVFRITRNKLTEELKALLIMPHYFSAVSFYDESFKSGVGFKRNTHQKKRQYSPNIIAYDLNHHDKVFYVLIKNTMAKKVKFLIQNRNAVKSYDQKLIMTFTSVYSIILTLVFVNLVFFFYIRKVSYLYYSLFIFTSLFSILFHEGWIAYFQNLSLPIFGSYTRLIWIKLPGIFFWLFILSFLDLKKYSGFDYKLCKTMLIIEISIVSLLLSLYVIDVTGIYFIIAQIINLFAILAVFIALYISIKYAITIRHQAVYLALGWCVYLLTLWLRIYYSFNLEPMAFWMPRAFEFGLMFEAIILSFGLADKTMRIMQQRDVAEYSLQKVDRELFCKELNDDFQQKANKTIENYFGSRQQLDKIIDWYYTSSFQKLVEIRAVFYVYEHKKSIGSKYLSEPLVDFDVDKYVEDNHDFLNVVCAHKKAVYQNYSFSVESVLRFIVIPIEKKKTDNLCLFLTLPEYVMINNDLLEDLYVFANTMTESLLTVRKLQKTVESARFDALTHVLNRKSMDTKISEITQKARQKNTSIAIAFIDIDDFKDINDQFGHEVGDACLQFLCDELKTELINDVYIGRFGGDEFIAVFDNYSKLEIKQKLENIYAFYKDTAIREIYLSVSMGIAIGHNQNNLLKDKELMRAADRALYQSKEKGKNQFTFFEV